MLQRLIKLDYTTVKFYRIPSLLNCLDKVFKRVVADMLSKRFKVSLILHDSQMGFRRQKSFKDVIARVVDKVQKL